jgi:hypothetical protein
VLGRLRIGLLIAASLAAAALASVARAQSPNDGVPIPATPAESLTAIQRSFGLPPAPRLTLFPQMREQLQDTPAFLRDSKVDFNVRSYYRDNVEVSPKGTTVNEAWAGGGAGQVNVETGRIFDIVSGGFTLYTSFPIYAPLQYGNSQLLLPDQQGYAVVGQVYGQLHLMDDTYFTAGRYIWNTPYLNAHDNRMTPNTFYGYALEGSIGDAAGGKPAVRYGGGYIATVKPRDAVDFQSMARAAGVNTDAGVGVGGARLDWGPATIGALEYFCQDTINIAYVEGLYGTDLPLGLRGVLAMQYADQRSTGANLLNGGTYWSTGQFGTRLQLGYQDAILNVGFSAVNPGFAMQSPWSSNPIYTDAQIQSFQRAGEQTVMAGLSYVLTRIGMPGVAASVFYYNGATNSAVAGKPLVESEWDFNLEWRPDWKPLQGLWLRARYGHSDTYQGTSLTTTDELRLVLNYNVKLY